MDESKIKGAFQKVKEDISSLKIQLDALTSEFEQIKRTTGQTDKPADRPTDQINSPADATKMPSNTPTTQTDGSPSILKEGLNAVKIQNFSVSTGNRGVQTDQQTNQQTDQQTDSRADKFIFPHTNNSPSQKFVLNTIMDDPVMKIEKVAELVNSLDNLKKDLRRQFKKLTPQEMLVFSTIYQLTDQAIDVDYSLLSKKTTLSESSIRDYVQKLLKKGIPLEKTKENNKRILLTIPLEFKRIASLETLSSLRSL